MQPKNFYHSTSLYSETLKHLSVTKYEDSTVGVEYRHIPHRDTEGDPKTHDPQSQPVGVDTVFEGSYQAMLFGRETAKQAIMVTRAEKSEDWREAWVHDWAVDTYDKLINAAEKVLRSLPTPDSDRSPSSIYDSVTNELVHLAPNLPRLSSETLIHAQEAYNERQGEGQ